VTASPWVPRIVALEGMSGIGKSRVARALVSAGTSVALLPEAVDRIPSPPSLAVPDRRRLWAVERRLFHEEQHRYRRALELRGRGHLVVADTGFLGPLTYSVGLARIDRHRDVVAPLRAEYERATIDGRIGLADLTILLDASPATRRRRVARDPVGHPPELRRRHATVGRFEHRLWTGPLGAALGPRFRRISAAGPVATVAERVRAAWEDRRSPRAWTAAASGRELLEMLQGSSFGKR
jgi:hypothetical protein